MKRDEKKREDGVRIIGRVEEEEEKREDEKNRKERGGGKKRSEEMGHDRTGWKQKRR